MSGWEEAFFGAAAANGSRPITVGLGTIGESIMPAENVMSSSIYRLPNG
jgi:hypothetical protein